MYGSSLDIHPKEFQHFMNSTSYKDTIEYKYFMNFINDHEDFSGWVFLAWLIAPFVGFGNLVGKLFRSNFINNYNHEYENILNKYKSISKK